MISKKESELDNLDNPANMFQPEPEKPKPKQPKKPKKDLHGGSAKKAKSRTTITRAKTVNRKPKQTKSTVKTPSQHKEKRSKHRPLLLTPTLDERLGVIATGKKISVNELINRVLTSYVDDELANDPDFKQLIKNMEQLKKLQAKIQNRS